MALHESYKHGPPRLAPDSLIYINNVKSDNMKKDYDFRDLDKVPVKYKRKRPKKGLIVNGVRVIITHEARVKVKDRAKLEAWRQRLYKHIHSAMRSEFEGIDPKAFDIKINFSVLE